MLPHHAYLEVGWVCKGLISLTRKESNKTASYSNYFYVKTKAYEKSSKIYSSVLHPLSLFSPKKQIWPTSSSMATFLHNRSSGQHGWMAQGNCVWNYKCCVPDFPVFFIFIIYKHLSFSLPFFLIQFDNNTHSFNSSLT